MPMEICMERMGQAWDEIVQVDEVLCFCKPERPSYSPSGLWLTLEYRSLDSQT